MNWGFSISSSRAKASSSREMKLSPSSFVKNWSVPRRYFPVRLPSAMCSEGFHLFYHTYNYIEITKHSILKDAMRVWFPLIITWFPIIVTRWLRQPPNSLEARDTMRGNRSDDGGKQYTMRDRQTRSASSPSERLVVFFWCLVFQARMVQVASTGVDGQATLPTHTLRSTCCRGVWYH
jgi:hypothetical protein